MRKSLKATLALSVALAGTSATTTASAGANPLLGEIMEVGYTFCPRGYFDANGALLPIASYTALFSLYGTTYGGDGRTTFALPDLRGRVSIGQGQGPGLSNYFQGSRGGAETVTLTASQMPSHEHGPHTHRAGIRTVADAPNTNNPAGNSFAKQAAGDNIYSTVDPNPNNMNPRFMSPDTMFVEPASSGFAGGSQSHENRMPYLATRKCVAIQGVFPSRN